MWRHFGKVLALLALPVVMLVPAAALSQNLDLGDQTASTVGQTVTFTVSIATAPSEVTAYAFDVVFDPAVLQFQTATAVGLAANTFVGANVPQPGRLRVGGFTVTTGDPATFVPIAAGSSGSLVQITFTVLALQATTLTLENLQDDFAEPGWVPGPGQLMIGVGTFDMDANDTSDTLTDGIMIARFLVGFPIDLVIANAVAPNCQRCTAAEIEAILQQTQPLLDIDANGTSDTLTDGIMIARFLVGFPIDLVIANAVAPNCQRCTAAEIEAYLQSFE